MDQLRQAEAELADAKEQVEAVFQKVEVAVKGARVAEEKAQKASKKQVIAEWAFKQVDRLAKKKRSEAEARRNDAISTRKIAGEWKKRAKQLKVAVKVMIAVHQTKYKAYEKAKSKMLGAFARRSKSRGITRSTVSTQAPLWLPKSPPPVARQMPRKRPQDRTNSVE